jgi:hypothetical protein
MIGSASRIPGCQRIVLRLEAELARRKQLRVLLERNAAARPQNIEQAAWLRAVADSNDGEIDELTRLIAAGRELPGGENVRAHRARIARKRKTEPVTAADNWQVRLYES